MDLFRSLAKLPTHLPAQDARLDGASAMARDFAGLLGTAEALARTGREVDLRGLEHLGGRLCAAALDLPPDQGRTFRPLLAGLLARLDVLQAALLESLPR